MYRCNCCKILFEQPNEIIEKGGVCDNPFGYGTCREPDHLVAECPECGARDFDYATFNGSDCPQCGEEIDDKFVQYTKTADGDYWEYECPHCKFLLQVANGEWLEE